MPTRTGAKKDTNKMVMTSTVECLGPITEIVNDIFVIAYGAPTLITENVNGHFDVTVTAEAARLAELLCYWGHDDAGMAIL